MLRSRFIPRRRVFTASLSSSDAVRQRRIGGHVSAGGHAVPIIETNGHVGGQAFWGWNGREIGPVN
jgi:hypothetical protein